MEGFTPGWNDPPKNVKSTGNLKINLNKRVAFPLSSSASSPPTATPLLLPPKAPSRLPDQTNADPEEAAVSDEDLSSKKEKVLSVLNHEVEGLSASIKSSVATKLKTLEEDWAKSDSEVKKHLVELVEHLEAKDVKSAEAVQRKLVLKGTNGQWLHALRQIIMNLEKRDEDSYIASQE